MRMNYSFSVIARCKKIAKGSNDGFEVKEDIALNFDTEKAEAFLFRFNNGMMLDNYKVLFRTNYDGKFEGVALFQDEYIYIITNLNQVINDIIKGYKYLIIADKMNDILSYDFNAALDFSEVEDEFGEE